MAAKERQEFIIALCQETRDTGSPDVLVEDWNKPCVLLRVHLDHTAHGDTKTLHTIRTCMGLPVVS